MRIQITGSRDFTNRHLIEAAIVEEMAASDDWPRITPTVVHGGARGADQIAGYVAQRRNLNVEVFLANWKRYGNMAGPIRNVEMLDTKPDVVLAFFKRGAKNAGTRNLVNEARLRGIPVKEFWEE